MGIVKTEFEATFNGESTKRDGVVLLNFKVPQSNMSEVVRSVLFIDKPLRAAVQVEGEREIHKVGKVSFHGLAIDREGETKLRLETDLQAMKLSREVVRNMIDKIVTVTLFTPKKD